MANIIVNIVISIAFVLSIINLWLCCKEEKELKRQQKERDKTYKIIKDFIKKELENEEKRN